MAVSRSSRWAASWARFLYVEYFSISPGCFSPSFSSPDETACEQNRGVEGTLGPEASAGGQQDTWLPGCLPLPQAGGPVCCRPPQENESTAPGVHQDPLELGAHREGKPDHHEAVCR